MVDDEAAGVTADAGVKVSGTFVFICCFEANGEDIGDCQPCLSEPLAKPGGDVADGAILRCAIAELLFKSLSAFSLTAEWPVAAGPYFWMPDLPM